MNETEYALQNNNAQIEEMEEDEDGVYQDNDEGGDDEIEERLQKPNVQPNNFNIATSDMQDNDDIFKQYTREEIENFKCIFDMFDQEKSGSVDTQHL